MLFALRSLMIRGVLMSSEWRPRVLFVEDDEDAFSVTTAMLERLGYRVTAETRSLGALRRFSQEPELFDCAILAYKMADLTGLELARRFRRIRPGFPIVLYTAYREAPSPAERKTAGIEVVVYKPATMRHLAEALKVTLG